MVPAFIQDIQQIRNDSKHNVQRIFSWNKNGHKALIALATDDMLFATTHTSLFDILILEFDKYFSTTVLQGSQLSFLNYRII